MQTFITDTDVSKSMQSLDVKRLGKQRVEAKQIYLALTDPEYGWKSHPAVRMWAGYEQSLAEYALVCCHQWTYLGYEDSLTDWFRARLGPRSYVRPWWWWDARLILSHRSNLIRKNPTYYQHIWPNVPPDIEYFWPSNPSAFKDTDKIMAILDTLPDDTDLGILPVPATRISPTGIMMPVTPDETLIQ